MNEVILVNESDEPIGRMEKMQAHEEGRLHRAFSIFLFNDKGEMLLQQRSATKYHSPNLWTNACCSHPMPDEELNDATARRLKEELDLEGIILKKEFSFIYKAVLENGLTEHEYDHVFIGYYNRLPPVIKEEASAYRFISFSALTEEIKQTPDKFSAWFKIALPELMEKISAQSF